MIRFLNKFKIPTLLGLGVIVAGIASGVSLIVKDQPFLIKASPNLVPQNITVSNIQDTEITISWQTSSATSSFITYGLQNPKQILSLDDRDTNTSKARFLHYVTIKNLQPDTTYLFKIISSKLLSETKNFKTAKKASFQNGFGPIISTVFDGNNPLDEAVAYLSISEANIQSAIIKDLGNFLIPISLMRKDDLSDTFHPKEDAIAKLTIIGSNGQANVLFKIKPEGVVLPQIRLGQNLDLTTFTPSIPQPTTQELDKFDLNQDQQINALDYSEVLVNFGPLREASKNPKDKKTDFNGDGIVDQKDLDLIQKFINQ